MGSISRGSPPRPEVTAAVESSSPVYTACSSLPIAVARRLTSLDFIYRRDKKEKKVTKQISVPCTSRSFEIFLAPLIINWRVQSIDLLVHYFREFSRDSLVEL